MEWNVGKILAALLMAFSMNVFADVEAYKTDINNTLNSVPSNWWSLMNSHLRRSADIKNQFSANLATVAKLEAAGLDASSQLAAIKDNADWLKSLSVNFEKPDSGYLKTEMGKIAAALASLDKDANKLLSDDAAAKKKIANDAKLQQNAAAAAEARDLIREISTLSGRMATCATTNSAVAEHAKSSAASISAQINHTRSRIRDVEAQAKAAKDLVAGNDKKLAEKLNEDDLLLKETNGLIEDAGKAMEKFKDGKCEEELASTAKQNFTNCEKGLADIKKILEKNSPMASKLEEELAKLNGPEAVKEYCEVEIAACTKPAKQAIARKVKLINEDLQVFREIRTNMQQLDTQVREAMGSAGNKSELAKQARLAFEQNKMDHINSIQRMRLRISMGIQELELNNMALQLRTSDTNAAAKALDTQLKEVLMKQKDSYLEEASTANARRQKCLEWKREVQNAKSMDQVRTLAAQLDSSTMSASSSGQVPATNR
jgi:hypothetical protein